MDSDNNALETVNSVDSIADKLAEVSLEQSMFTTEQRNVEARAAYINLKLAPTDVKEKALLEKKLALTYSDKEFNQLLTDLAGESIPELITRESKLADYAKQLGCDFDELNDLTDQAAFILEEHANAHFKPETISRHFFESDDRYEARSKQVHAEQRTKFIQDNSETVLLNALRAEIRHPQRVIPEGVDALDKEEKAQTILTPLYKARIDQRNQEVVQLGKDRVNERYYAKPSVVPVKHITNDAPELSSAVGTHYRMNLLQNELAKKVNPTLMSSTEQAKRHALIEQNQQKSDAASLVNKNVTDGRVLDSRNKKFRSIV